MLGSDNASLLPFPVQPECWHFTDNFQNRALPFLDYILAATFKSNYLH